MSAWVEVMVAENGRALLEATHIKGVLAFPGTGTDKMATPGEPITLIMASGETLPGVYGVSPDRLLLHIAGVKAILRSSGRLVVVAYLDSIPELEVQIGQALSGGREDVEAG